MAAVDGEGEEEEVADSGVAVTVVDTEEVVDIAAPVLRKLSTSCKMRPSPKTNEKRVLHV